MNSRHHDRGFTLIEVTVAVALLGIVTLSVGAALYLGIRTTNNTYTRLGQSNAELAVTRYLSGDIFAAEGPVIVNSTTDSTCGGVAPLKLWSRSLVTASTRDTMTVWVLTGTNLVRRVCVGGVQVSSRVVAHGIDRFTPATCAAPCTAATVTVVFRAAADGAIPTQSWSLTMGRRGATS